MARRRGTIVARNATDGARYRARVRVQKKDIYGPWRTSRKRAEEDLRGMQQAERKAEALLDGVTLGRAWREHQLRLEARGVKDSTMRGYRWKWGALQSFFKPTALVAALDPGDVEAYVRHRRRSAKMRTVHHELALLRAVLNTAVKREWIRTNPVTQAELPRVSDERLPDWFTRAELAAVLIRIRAALSQRDTERDADTIEFLALTGLRLSEAAALEVRDVDLQRCLISVRQGKRGSRTARITKRLKPIMRRLTEGRITPKTRVLDSFEQLKWMFRYWQDKLEEPRLHAHALRHTFATLLARESGSPYVVMQALGHSNIKMAQRYCHMAGVDTEHLEALSYEPPAESSPAEGHDDG